MKERVGPLPLGQPLLGVVRFVLLLLGVVEHDGELVATLARPLGVRVANVVQLDVAVLAPFARLVARLVLRVLPVVLPRRVTVRGLFLLLLRPRLPAALLPALVRLLLPPEPGVPVLPLLGLGAGEPPWAPTAELFGQNPLLDVLLG